MAAPTFIQEAETVWNTSTSPKTTASFNVQTGDLLVALLVGADSGGGTGGFSISGGSLSWTTQQEIGVASYCSCTVWTTVATSTTSVTVTFTRNMAAVLYGGNVLTFRGSDGVGASSKTNVASGAPTLNLTTTQANSAIVVVNGDWTATDGASRTWRTNAGTFT